MDLKHELEQRWYLKQCTNEEVLELFDKGGQKFYAGFDPTAPSLHLGNFIVVMHALQYMLRGNKFLIVLGGATSMIGDPGGKDSERSFLSDGEVAANFRAIRTQVMQLMSNIEAVVGQKLDYEIMDNMELYTTRGWAHDLGLLPFLRDVGKHVTVNSMLSKDTVKKRVEDPSKSISFTEFAYMLLQANDFCDLYQYRWVTLQIAGSDQWWNIVTGLELISKKLGKEAYGITSPLVVDSNGKKFGKSEGNALWLDKDKTSPYALYQYLLNTSDEDLEGYLKLLTPLSLPHIAEVITRHGKVPASRYGQKVLAHSVVEMLHGSKGASDANHITEILFQNRVGEPMDWKLKGLDHTGRESLLAATGGTSLHDNTPLRFVLTRAQVCSSAREAKELIESGSIEINGTVISDYAQVVTAAWYINGILLIKRGKKTRRTVLLQYTE